MGGFEIFFTSFKASMQYLYRQIHIGIQINMRLVTINAPFCSQKHVGHASEGFYFVNNGVLVFRDDNMMITIYEGKTFQTNGGYDSIPALQINLRTVASIEFKKIYSTGLNFEGGNGNNHWYVLSRKPEDCHNQNE